jgi:hypothetical protein
MRVRPPVCVLLRAGGWACVRECERARVRAHAICFTRQGPNGSSNSGALGRLSPSSTALARARGTEVDMYGPQQDTEHTR